MIREQREELKRFKESLEELVWEYLHNLPKEFHFESVDFNYSVDEGHGELVFRFDKKDVLYKIKKI
jgi:hypothetical protein